MEINNYKELQEAILHLKRKEVMQKEMLVEQFHDITESLKPKNIIKNAVSNFAGKGMAGDVMDAAMGIGAGILSKKMLVGKSAGIVKKLLGVALEFGVAKVVANNSDKLRGGAVKLFSNFFKSKKKPVERIEQY